MHIKTIRAAILSVMLLACVFMLTMLGITTSQNNMAKGVPVIAPESQDGKRYTVRAYNGHIAVFYGDITDTPAIETTIDIENLRAVDRAKLLEGITVENYDDVLKLLEDFSS